MDIHSLRRLTRWHSIHRGNPLPVNFRLSLLMFLLYAAPGAFFPLFSLRLAELGFSPTQMGWCCATQALGSLLAPLLAGQIADRWWPAEKCLAVAAFGSAGALWLLGSLATPAAVFAASLLFWLLMAPEFTLTTAICFAHVKDAQRDFGRVRMWGTVGWVLPGWLFGFWLADSDRLLPLFAGLHLGQPHAGLTDSFRLAAVLSVVFGLYAWTLPRTTPRRSGGAAPLAAFRVLRGRAFYVYAFCTFGVCIALPFSTQVTPLLLKSMGVAQAWIPRLLTIAQASEAISLFALPFALRRLGVRGTMRLGLFAAVLTLGGLAQGELVGLALCGFALYGLCISCYLVVGQMYLNHHTRDDIRASAQAMHSVLCGLGLLIGNVLAGEVRGWFEGAFAPTFAVAAILSIFLLLIFAIGFPGDPARRTA